MVSSSTDLRLRPAGELPKTPDAIRPFGVPDDALAWCTLGQRAFFAGPAEQGPQLWVVEPDQDAVHLWSPATSLGSSEIRGISVIEGSRPSLAVLTERALLLLRFWQNHCELVDQLAIGGDHLVAVRAGRVLAFASGNRVLIVTATTSTLSPPAEVDSAKAPVAVDDEVWVTRHGAYFAVGIVNPTTPARAQQAPSSTRRWALIDDHGRTLSRGHREIGPMKCGRARYLPDSKRPHTRWGFLDRLGDPAIDPVYHHVGDFSMGRAPVAQRDGRWGFIDTTGTLIVDRRYPAVGHYAEGLCAFQDDEARWGALDLFGEVVIPPRWSELRPFHEGLAPVREGHRWGLIDRNGNVVVEPKYTALGDVSQARVAACWGAPWGYLHALGHTVIRPSFRAATSFAEGRAAVQRSPHEYVYIDLDGHERSPHPYESAWPFHSGTACVRLRSRFGLINLNYELVLEPRFTSPLHFHEGLALQPRRNRGVGYVNLSGHFAVEGPFSVGTPFSEGCASVMMNPS